MKTIICKEEDILPLVLSLLGLTSVHFGLRLSDMVIEKYYPDLKGLVINDYYDDSTADLLDATDDQLIQATYGSMKIIYDCGKCIENRYGLEDASKEDRLDDLVIDIFWSIVCYDDDTSYDESVINMKEYSGSVVHMLYALCLIARNGRLAIDAVFDEYDGARQFHAELTQLKDADLHIVRVLADAALKLEKQDRVFEDLIFGRR